MIECLVALQGPMFEQEKIKGTKMRKGTSQKGTRQIRQRGQNGQRRKYTHSPFYAIMMPIAWSGASGVLIVLTPESSYILVLPGTRSSCHSYFLSPVFPVTSSSCHSYFQSPVHPVPRSFCHSFFLSTVLPVTCTSCHPYFLSSVPRLQQ